MAKVIDKRMAAELDGEFVVFLIGMRINKPWKVRAWWPVFGAMPKSQVLTRSKAEEQRPTVKRRLDLLLLSS